jgi:hypothetical protein
MNDQISGKELAAPVAVPTSESTGAEAQVVKLTPAVEAAFGPRPVIVGENAEMYDRLLMFAIAERKPQSLNDWMTVKDMVDAQWGMLRSQRMRVWMFNAIIARAACAEMLDVEAANALSTEQESGTSLSEADVQQVLVDKGVVRFLTNMARAAVAGDVMAREFVEEKIGKGKLSIESAALAGMEATLAPLLQVDRLITADLARRNGANAHQVRLASQRPNQHAAEPPKSVQREAPITPHNPAEGSLADCLLALVKPKSAAATNADAVGKPSEEVAPAPSAAGSEPAKSSEDPPAAGGS